jgi:AhpD family alkylhydroperoxidase
MKARLNSFQAAPKSMQALLDFSETVQKSGLEHSLLCLIEIRASQINGCAFCLHMHSKDARAHDETEMRLYLLSAWRESPLYNERERAALAWTEAVTGINNAAVSDADFQALQAQFTPEEQVQLTLAITTINAWNRINVAFQTPHPKS